MKLNNLLLASSTSLILADRRLYNYLLHNAFQGLKKRLEFTIGLKDLEGVYGVGKPSKEQLNESIRKLMRTLVEFETTEQNRKQWHITSLLADAIFDEKDGLLRYRYPETCQILLTDPINLEKCLIQAHFNYKYSNLLYELLATEHYSGKSDYLIELEDLRECLHVEPDKMPNFTDFNRFVLEPALKEINSYASFAVKFDASRKGRKVTQIHFQFASKVPVTKLSVKDIIPPRRPKLFINDPKEELAYAYLLNATTIERRKYFSLAQKKAEKISQETIPEEYFDRPDLWYQWVVKTIQNKKI